MALYVVLALFAPLVSVNLAVAVLGRTAVSPLSPFFLREKTRALGLYARHRFKCGFSRHPPLQPLIDRTEQRLRLPRGLMAALVQIESEFRVHRISRTGAMGPRQLMPATAAYLGVLDPFDPVANINAGARYLQSHLRRFGSVRLAVAAYNAGPGAIVGGRVPRNGETEHYVEAVMREYASRSLR